MNSIQPFQSTFPLLFPISNKKAEVLGLISTHIETHTFQCPLPFTPNPSSEALTKTIHPFKLSVCQAYQRRTVLQANLNILTEDNWLFSSRRCAHGESPFVCASSNEHGLAFLSKTPSLSIEQKQNYPPLFHIICYLNYHGANFPPPTILHIFPDSIKKEASCKLEAIIQKLSGIMRHVMRDSWYPCFFYYLDNTQKCYHQNTVSPIPAYIQTPTITTDFSLHLICTDVACRVIRNPSKCG